MVGTLDLRAPLGVTVPARWVGTSGRPFSLVVDGDVDGDDANGNDRAFLFDPDDPSTPPDVAASMRRVLANPDNLARDHSWGAQYLRPVGISSQNPAVNRVPLLRVIGFDPTALRYRYTVNETAGVLPKGGTRTSSRSGCGCRADAAADRAGGGEVYPGVRVGRPACVARPICHGASPLPLIRRTVVRRPLHRFTLAPGASRVFEHDAGASKLRAAVGARRLWLAAWLEGRPDAKVAAGDAVVR